MNAQHTPGRYDIDPRGPLVKSVSLVRRSDGVAVTYDCGHTGEHAQHFHHVVGDNYRCFQCGRDAIRRVIAESEIDPCHDDLCEMYGCTGACVQQYADEDKATGSAS